MNIQRNAVVIMQTLLKYASEVTAATYALFSVRVSHVFGRAAVL